VTEAVGTRLSVRARDLLAGGPDALPRLPTPEQLAAERDTRRRRLLEGLRVELYAVSSILAELAVQRAYRRRAEHPPYGLVRSGHTDWKLVLATPEPVAEGGIGSFHALGKVFVDTVVFHLHQEFADLQASDRAWLIRRLEALLALFRPEAGPLAPRMRDALSFIYGGLHFGTGVCVQLAEVMTRVLDDRPELGLDEAAKAEIMGRSLRPAYRLAALNVEQVVPTYDRLLLPPGPPPGPRTGGTAAVRWFDARHFEVQEADGRPVRVEFRDEEELTRPPGAGTGDGRAQTWTTQGCPARISPTGGTPAIAVLWAWCVDLARAAGLLSEAVEG
jgi:hypothetical protein